MSTNQIYQFFAKFIEDEIGVIYAEHNYYQLQSRLDEISHLQGLANVEELFQLALKGISGKLKQQLLDISTNNETSFFRDGKVFAALESHMLNEVLSRYPTEKLNIWSAASSTGQEAISLCIQILEWMNSHNKKIDFDIVATDISERVLTKARQAQYTQLEVQRGLNNELLRKYFLQIESNFWTVSREISSKIHYKQLNLRHSFPFIEKFHIIFCRNVLIYQKVESKIDILNRLTNQLVSGGYLILGSGESLLGLSNDYDQVVEQGVVLYRKRSTLLSAA